MLPLGETELKYMYDLSIISYHVKNSISSQEIFKYSKHKEKTSKTQLSWKALTHYSYTMTTDEKHTYI